MSDKKMTTSGSPQDEVGLQSTSNVGAQMYAIPTRPPPINTSVAQGTNASVFAPGGTASSSFSSNGTTSTSRHFTPATSLYSPSIWSPIKPSEATQSALMHPKPSWETSLAQQASSAKKPQNGKAKSPLGLGVQFGSFGHDNGGNQSIPAPATKYNYTQREIAQPLISPFDIDTVKSNANTYPLMQQPFGAPRVTSDQTRVLPKKAWAVPLALPPASTGATPQLTTAVGATNKEHDKESIVSNPYEEDVKSQAAVSIGDIDSVGKSTISALSRHFTEVHPEKKSQVAPVLSAEPNAENFQLQSLRLGIELEEAFPGARDTLQCLNPSHWKMEWDTRVVCIKSEYTENIFWSIKTSKWVIMDRVGERLMRMWDDRPTPQDDIIFLVSVNGQKQYCGLAIMRGPWKKDSNCEGWKSATGEKTYGTVPVEWKYVKNVPYERFHKIKHEHNGHSIVNMWNGMHFPQDKAREVVEIYVNEPHRTNVLCWRLDRLYAPYKGLTPAPKLVPGSPAVEGGKHPLKIENKHAASQNGTTGATANTQRQPLPHHHGDHTPVGPVRRGVVHGTVPATPPTFDGPTSPSPVPGQLIQCIVDENGDYIPLTPTHQPSPRPPMPRIPAGDPNFMRSQQAFQAHRQSLHAQQRADFHNNGAVFNGPASARGGRRGPPTPLNRASFAASAGFHGPNFSGPSTQSPLRHAHSFTNDSNFHVPPHSAGSATFPTTQYMDPRTGSNAPASMMNNLQNDRSGANLGTSQNPLFSRSNSTTMLRPAASEAPVFTPQNSGATQPMNPTFVGGSGTSVLNEHRTQFSGNGAGFNSPGQHHHSYGPAALINGMPIYAPNAQRTASPKDTSEFMTLSGQPIYPTPTDTQPSEYTSSGQDGSDKEVKASEWTELNRELSEVADLMQRKMIDLQSKFSKVSYDQGKTEKTTRQVLMDSPEDNKSMHTDDYQLEYGAWASTSSCEKRNITPVRGEDGHIVESASKHNSPENKAAIEKHNRTERWLRTGIPTNYRSTTSKFARLMAGVRDVDTSSPESSFEAEETLDEDTGDDDENATPTDTMSVMSDDTRGGVSLV